MKKQTGIKKKKLAVWAASAAAVLMLCGVSGYAYYTPYSYVSLDVNPSIEFTLNRFDRVLSARGVNDDGEAVMLDVDLADLSNKSIGDAISKTVYKISKLGYFNGDEDGGIVIATSAKNPEKASELAEELQQTVSDQLASEGNQPVTEDKAENDKAAITAVGAGSSSESSATVSPAPDDASDEDVPAETDQTAEDGGNNVIVEVISVGLERVEQARELGVTPGRLHLVEKLQQSAASPDDVNVDEWLKKPVKEIMKATIENKKAQKAQAKAAGTDADAEETEDDQNQNDQSQTEAQGQDQTQQQAQPQSQGQVKDRNRDNSRDTGNFKENANDKNKSRHNEKSGSDLSNQSGQIPNEQPKQTDYGTNDDGGTTERNNSGRDNGGRSSGDKDHSDSGDRR